MNWLKKNSVMPGLTGQLIAVVLFLLSFPLQAQDVLSSGNWTREQVADGIVLSRAVFEGNLFGSNQYLCVLEVAPGARFDIVPAEEGTLETTTALAVRTGAVAAVNGSFFNMRKPYGSVNYLRVDGTEVSPNVLRGVRNTRRTLQQTGAVATWEGSLYMLKGDVLARWERDIEAEDIVTTGPMLLVGGECEPVKKDGFNTARHPRTAVGRRADGTVVLVVADGRNELAAGLTMAELQQVMAALGCRDAINLDGGGSTTMVVRGAVVNHPSDNGQFDVDGERPVANAIVISLP
ncbi:MAG: phosphodiester glycosidase family protein [Bacteroidales bacterium]|nr:phosphodiester glycosidase family protein [Bacteroidales bacterium]